MRLMGECASPALRRWASDWSERDRDAAAVFVLCDAERPPTLLRQRFCLTPLLSL